VFPPAFGQGQSANPQDAGLDRLNHNLNTSEKNYPNICSTHTFEDRLNTLKAARDVGMEVCSGMIIGMGEEAPDVIEGR